MAQGGGIDYARTYWLCYLGVGLLFGVQGLFDYAVTGAVTVDVVLSLLVATLIATVSVYALRAPGTVSAPQRPNLLFVVAVVAFVVLVALTILRLVAL